MHPERAADSLFGAEPMQESMRQNHVRLKIDFASRFKPITPVKPCRRKFLVLFFRKYVSLPPSRLIEKGRTRRHDTWSAGCDGRDGDSRRLAVTRTVKS